MELDIWIESHDFPIARIKRDGSLSIEFSYLADYLKSAHAIPLSLKLPLKEGVYYDRECRPYFQNLLPENDLVDRTIEREGIERNDVAGLLYFLGSDTSGAISCIPRGNGPVKKPGSLISDYDSLNTHEFAEIVSRLANKKPLPASVRDPSPLAGVQRKLAITMMPDEKWAIPKPGIGVPTTHILKVPEKSKAREASLETVSALLAHACDLEVSIPIPLNVEGNHAIVLKRYDRETYSNHVTRIHQEDFAQAIGLPPSMKYQRHGVGEQVFNVLRISEILEQCSIPAQATKSFIRSVFFNLLIGNNDNHAKNYSLLYDQGAAPRLAPFYDMLPILLNPSYTDELAFNIGTSKYSRDLKRTDFMIFFEQLGIKGGAATRMVEQIVRELIEGIESQAEKYLVTEGLIDFDNLFGREAELISELLEIEINIRTRDLYVPKAGGWM